MSTLNDISSYGKQFNIAVANTDCDTILQASGLPANVIIISAPTDDAGADKNIYSLLITDSNGVPAVLTKPIMQANGLYASDNNPNTLHLHIDNDTIKTNDDGALYIDIDSLIDNTTLINSNGKISVNTAALNYASKNNVGIIKPDGYTIRVGSDGILYVDTSSLSFATSDAPGIITSDGDTITIKNKGIIYVNTENLKHSSADDFGISRQDDITVINKDGIYSVNTEALERASSNNYGVSKCDGSTIISNNGVYSINTGKLNKASSDRYGTIQLDGNSLIDDNGLSVAGYEHIADTIRNIDENMDGLNVIYEEIKKRLQELSINIE